LKITFTLPFRTTYGESLVIIGSTPQLGQWETARGLQMHYHPDGLWQADIRLPGEESKPFTYRYVIDDRNRGIIHEEGGEHRRFAPSDFRGTETIELRDFWRRR